MLKTFLKPFAILLISTSVLCACAGDSDSSTGGGGTPLTPTRVSLTVQVNDPNLFVSLAFVGGLKDFDWGDGSPVVSTVSNQTDFDHLYPTSGSYTITFKDNGCTDFTAYGLGLGAEYYFTRISGISLLTQLTALRLASNSFGTFDTSVLPATLQTLELADTQLTSFDATLLPTPLTRLSINLNPSLPSSVVTQIFARLVASGQNNGVLNLPAKTFTAGSPTCVDRATLRAAPRNWTTTGTIGCL